MTDRILSYVKVTDEDCAVLVGESLKAIVDYMSKKFDVIPKFDYWSDSSYHRFKTGLRPGKYGIWHKIDDPYAGGVYNLGY